MILPDLNLLLYAYNSHAPLHLKAVDWWSGVINGEELIGLPHEVTLGFVRIATNRRLGAAAVSLAAAQNVVSQWLELPHSRVLLPAPDHFERVMEITRQAGGSSPLISDASLAAYAISSRATLCSNDGDFSKFRGLNWRNPLVE